MSLAQFRNTLRQIGHAEHLPYLPALIRHLAWLGRRTLSLFPVEIRISQSRMIIDRHSGVAALINCLGMYDYNNMTLIVDVLRRAEHGSWFFDVGANIGAYTLVASEVEHVRVASFEPGANAFHALKVNVGANSRTNVTLFPYAVSDAPGNVFLTDGVESSLNRVVPEQSAGFEAVNVKAVTLDEICRQLQCNPKIVKIDVEGFEAHVLRGFEEHIRNVDLMIVEGGALPPARDFLQQHDCDGPWYFDASRKEFHALPFGREEDPVFVRKSFRRTLEEWGYTVLR